MEPQLDLPGTPPPTKPAASRSRARKKPLMPGTIAMVPVTDIRPNPNHLHLHQAGPEHEALVRSLSEAGQDEPITLYLEVGGRLVVRSGHRIVAAAREAGLSHLRAEIYSPVDRLEDLLRRLRAEQHKIDAPALEVCRIVKEVRDLRLEGGLVASTGELAPYVSMTHTEVGVRLRVAARMTAELIDAAGVTEGDVAPLSLSALRTIVGKPAAERAAALSERVERGERRGRRPGTQTVRLTLGAGGGIALTAPNPNRLPPTAAARLLSDLTPYLNALKRAAKGRTAA
jgi:hypothetical protein